MSAPRFDPADLNLSKLVAITGAGFSKHVSDAMPVLSELGDELLLRLRGDDVVQRLLPSEREALRRGHVPMGNVEAWLTSLASTHPFHAAPERLRRRASFLEVAEAIGEIVAGRESEAFAVPQPRWLQRLVTLWHHLQSSVLTFNYDTLIEAAVSDLVLWGPAVEQPNSPRRVMPRHLIEGFPPRLPLPGWTAFAEEFAGTFHLLKLHGSLNWWGRATANDLFAVVDGFGVPQWQPETQYAPPMNGLATFIVPPTADKSAQYGSGVVEAIWTAGAARVAEATLVVLFGYSVPITDTSAAALIGENLRPDVPVVVVDRNPAEVAERLRRWLPNPIYNVGHQDPVHHRAAVDEFVHALEAAAAARTPEFRTLHTGGETHECCYVEIATPDRLTFRCAGLSDRHLLAGEVDPDMGVLIRPPGPPVAAAQLLGMRTVQFSDGRVAPVYCFDRTQNTSEHSVIRVHSAP